jgi:hypothetical protein
VEQAFAGPSLTEAPHRHSRFVPPPPSVQLGDAIVVDETPVEAASMPAPAAAIEPAPHAAASVWDGLEDAPLEHASLEPGDPIAAFAPEPRMDWGPQKPRRRRKKSAPAELQPES